MLEAGAADADAAGDYYFVDAHWQQIYRWDAKRGELSTVRGTPLDYAFKPGAAEDALVILKPVEAAQRPGLTAVRPVGEWRPAKDASTRVPVSRPFHYLSPNGTTFLAVGGDFTTGAMNWGAKAPTSSAPSVSPPPSPANRRTHLVFGGADRRTLFIAARTSLYAVRTRVPASR